MSAEHQGPIREGVRHVEVGEDHAGVRLDNFLSRLLEGVPRSRIYRIVRRGEVRVNGARASPEQRLVTGDRVRVPPVHREAPGAGVPAKVPRPLMEAVQAAILSEDERLIVLNKPAGIAVHGGSGIGFGIIEALRAARPQETLELVHRLDRDTSGCLLVARKPQVLRELHELMRTGQVDKGYLALLRGQWNLGRKRIDVPLATHTRVGGERTVRVQAGGKEAVSTFTPVQFFGRLASLVEVDLETGRTHQIRVHAAHAGHPVAGDDKYGDEHFNATLQERGLGRMFLHAHRICFDWPRGGDFSASSPLPADLAAVLDALATDPKGGGHQSAGGHQNRR
ncbi:MAG TPA: RluA family pseudouridine synthase [Steroidobacteraceae bacterium]|nr:RluA family pseudouridine synthase [Steroidobacteraceae bacterium]